MGRNACLEKRHIIMFLFVYGDDTFRMQEKVSILRKKFEEKFDKNGMNVSVFPAPGKKLEPAEAFQTLATSPFLGEKRMVILHDIFSSLKKPDINFWQTQLEKVPDSTIVLFWETVSAEALKKQAWYKSLHKHKDVYDYFFPELQGSALEKWVLERSKQLSLFISPIFAKELVHRLGSDLWCMQKTLEKLSARANGKEITKEIIEEMVPFVFEDQIFALVDALSQRSAETCLRILKEQRSLGIDDVYLFGMFLRQVRLLLQVHSFLQIHPSATKQTIAQELEIHPFVAQKILLQARNFTQEELLFAHTFLFELDYKIKTGIEDGSLAVDLFISSFLKRDRFD